MLVRFDHVASRIVNEDYGITRTAVELCEIYRFADLQIQQPTEREHVADKIYAVMIFARTHFVSVNFLIEVVHCLIADLECGDVLPPCFHGVVLPFLRRGARNVWLTIVWPQMKTRVRTVVRSH